MEVRLDQHERRARAVLENRKINPCPTQDVLYFTLKTKRWSGPTFRETNPFPGNKNTYRSPGGGPLLPPPPPGPLRNPPRGGPLACSTRIRPPQTRRPSNDRTASSASRPSSNSMKAKPGGLRATQTSRRGPKRPNSLSSSPVEAW